MEKWCRRARCWRVLILWVYEMISQAELDRFYEGLVTEVRARGGMCAITSGMACVRYGVAHSTKDCDLLCVRHDAKSLLDILRASSFFGVGCGYRGNLTPPLDERWMAGGWTSHFQWRHNEAEAHLDVFGMAPRGSIQWERETDGLYANRHTVAEMKRTNRGKDWPFATALGVQMLTDGDARGWLHIFDADVLFEMVEKRDCPEPILQRRPMLQLALARDPKLRTALVVETHFWHELDRIRIRIYEQSVRAYRAAVMREQLRHEPDLMVQHSARVRCAELHLPINPLAEFGFDRMLAETLDGVRDLGEKWLGLLPDVRENYEELFR